MAENLFTVEEAANHLKVKVRTIRKYLKMGKLRGLKMGREWRITDSDMQAYIDSLKIESNKSQLAG